MTLKTAVFTLHDESTITVTDSANAMYATAALAQFSHYNTAKLVVVDGEKETVTYVPFHAVVKVVVTETESADEPVTDAFCPTGTDGE